MFDFSSALLSALLLSVCAGFWQCDEALIRCYPHLDASNFSTFSLCQLPGCICDRHGQLTQAPTSLLPLLKDCRGVAVGLTSLVDGDAALPRWLRGHPSRRSHLLHAVGPSDVTHALLPSLRSLRLTPRTWHLFSRSALTSSSTISEVSLTSCDARSCTFDASSGEYFGTIPSLSNLTALTYFDVHNNSLSGELPSLRGLVNLQYFDVSANELIGGFNLTDILSSCPALAKLDLSGNFFSKLDAANLTSASLTYLDISANPISGRLPSFFQCPALTYFNASGVSLEIDLSGAQFAGAVNLTTLDLAGLQLRLFPLSILELTELNYLDLSRNSFVKNYVPDFSLLAKLAVLKLSSGAVGSSSGLLAKLPDSLTSFDCRSCGIEGNLTQLPSGLLSLDLSDNSLIGRMTDALAGLSLEYIDVSNNPRLETSLSEILSSSVVEARIDRTILVEGYDSSQMSKDLSNLRTLSMSSVNLLSAPMVAMSGISNLRYLDLSYNGIYLESSSADIFALLPPSIEYVALHNNPLGSRGVQINYNSLALLTNVVEIDFNTAELSGPIPNLTLPNSLRDLDLSFNFINGSFPFLVSSGLEGLYLQQNRIHGPISSINGLPRLVRLDVSRNSLQGSIPAFPIPSYISVLKLADNNLTGELPYFWPVIPMDEVDISGNSLSGQIYHGDMEVVDLDFSANQLSGNIPRFSSHNVHVSLGYNSLSGPFPDITPAAKLSTLDLTACVFSESTSILNQASFVLHLQTVRLSQCNLTLANLWFLQYWNQLIELDMSNNRLSGTLPLLDRFSALESLDLSTNQLSGTIPPLVQSSLQSVFLGYNNFSGSLPTIGSSGIATLSLVNNSLSGDLDVTSFGPFTKRVYLSGNAFITCSGVSTSNFILDLYNNPFWCPVCSPSVALYPDFRPAFLCPKVQSFADIIAAFASIQWTVAFADNSSTSLLAPTTHRGGVTSSTTSTSRTVTYTESIGVNLLERIENGKSSVTLSSVTVGRFDVSFEFPASILIVSGIISLSRDGLVTSSDTSNLAFVGSSASNSSQYSATLSEVVTISAEQMEPIIITLQLDIPVDDTSVASFNMSMVAYLTLPSGEYISSLDGVHATIEFPEYVFSSGVSNTSYSYYYLFTLTLLLAFFVVLRPYLWTKFRSWIISVRIQRSKNRMRNFLRKEFNLLKNPTLSETLRLDSGKCLRQLLVDKKVTFEEAIAVVKPGTSCSLLMIEMNAHRKVFPRLISDVESVIARTEFPTIPSSTTVDALAKYFVDKDWVYTCAMLETLFSRIMEQDSASSKLLGESSPLSTFATTPSAYDIRSSSRSGALSGILSKLGDGVTDARVHSNADEVSEFLCDHYYFQSSYYPWLSVMDYLWHALPSHYGSVLRAVLLLHAWRAASNCGSSIISPHDSFAIYVYTAELRELPNTLGELSNYNFATGLSCDKQLYAELNAAMRNHDASGISQWRTLIYHIDTALRRLPPTRTHRLYRGIPISYDPDIYAPGKIVSWAAFSSTSASSDVAKAFAGLDVEEKRESSSGTVFILSSLHAREISPYSAIPHEEERMLLPFSRLLVKEALDEEQRSFLGLANLQVLILQQLPDHSDVTDDEIYGAMNQTQLANALKDLLDARDDMRYNLKTCSRDIAASEIRTSVFRDQMVHHESAVKNAETSIMLVRGLLAQGLQGNRRPSHFSIFRRASVAPAPEPEPIPVQNLTEQPENDPDVV